MRLPTAFASLLLSSVVTALLTQTAFGEIYREDFPAGDLPAAGWDASYIGGNGNSAGTTAGGGDEFHWWYNNTALSDPPTEVTGASVTGEFGSIDAGTPGLTINWQQRQERSFDNDFADAPGIPIDVRIAVEVGGAWYASAAAFPTSGESQFSDGPWTEHSLGYDPAAANWLDLTLAAPGATIGGAAGADLAGDITGLGFVSTFSQYGTVNFNYVQVVPEPAAAALLTACAMVVPTRRRRRDDS